MIESEKINKIFEIKYGIENGRLLRELIKQNDIINYKIYDEFLLYDDKIIDIKFENSEVLIIFENLKGVKFVLSFKLNQLLNGLKEKIQTHNAGIIIIWNYIKTNEENPLANIYIFSNNQITGISRFIDFLQFSKQDTQFD